MWKKFSKEQKRMVIVSSAICFVFLFFVYIYLIQNDISAEKDRCRYIAENEADHIVTTIDCVMARTGTLRAMVQDHDGDTAFFNHVAEDIYTTVKEETGVDLKNFAIAPDGIVSEIYPLEGNESFLGFDFLDTSLLGNLEAREAYEEGNTILTNPFELVQGGVGMAGRAPVILRDGDERKLWGLVTVTIDLDNLIKVLRLDNLIGMGMDYTLSYIDENGEPQIIHEGGKPGKDPLRTRFSLRNLTWELAIEPSGGWVNPWRLVMSTLVIIIVSGFAGEFANMVFQLRQSNTMLRRLSNTDRMTGCLNRRAYEDALSELEKKLHDKSFIYVTADVNGLKQVNDNKGHLSGDELLCGASDCLQESFGEYGNVYRIGGDEFVAMLSVDEKKLKEILDKLKHLTDEWKGESVDKLSISVGCASRAEFPHAAVSTLVKTADERMYEAKREHYSRLS
ncbi:MAG: sensor domain-containing diguanylate cyclase [Lachnospiraceae bacterium]|nr:sensor domain-containing diguanylate cyclase [Lachnospiraceae bacterium]